MIDPAVADAFLAERRIAVVGASEDRRKFGNTIYRELREHGYDAVAVNDHAATIEGDTCYPSLAAVPGDVDGVVVMVNAAAAPAVVDECAARGVPRVWLFKGLGAPGSSSEEAVRRCEAHGIEYVAGACPLMFLTPVKGLHRFHLALRRMNGSVKKAKAA
jgi:predicted CoA-binding protein